MPARPDRHPTPEPAASAALRAAAATAAYALAHTLFATHAAKRLAARLAGEDRARGWYRVAYNVQAVAGLGLLGAYVWRHRGPFVWHPAGAARAALRVGQAASLAAFGKALWDAGLGDLSGVRPARDYLTGRPLRPVPDGQGPFEDDAGRPAPRGLSLRVRQPTNFFIVPVMWVVPSARAGWVGMSAAFTAYSVLGAARGERMLRARWGAAERAYQTSGVPFLVPAAHEVPAARVVGRAGETGAGRAA
jgi:hypothetical protein